MPTSISVLSRKDRETIHGQALDLLGKVGIRFASEKALALLEAVGCEVDRSTLSAKIGPELVERALETLPSEFALPGRVTERDLVCGNGETYYTVGGQTPWYLDLETRQRRPATSADLVQCARLIEGLDEFGQWDYMVVPQDLPPRLGDLCCLKTSLLHSTKPTLGWITDPDAMPYAFEMLNAAAGGRDAFRERPFFSTYVSPLSPLSNDGTSVDVTLAWAPYRPPIMMLFMPMSPLSAPVMLESLVLQETAAFLGNMVLYQLAEPGWPIIWGTFGATTDMRSMMYRQGAEKNLMTLALIEMAQYFRVPCGALGLTTDAKSTGFQAGHDCVFSSSFLEMAGVDNIWGGTMDAATLADPAYAVLSAETIKQNRRMRQGLTFDAEHLMADVIEELGYHGKHMEHISTVMHFRTEHMESGLLPCESYDSWTARGQTEEEMALERAREILGDGTPEPADSGLDKELKRIMESAGSTLGT